MKTPPSKEAVYRQHNATLAVLSCCPLCGAETIEWVETSMKLSSRKYQCHFELFAQEDRGLEAIGACSTQSMLLAAWLNDLGLARAKA